MAILRDVFRPRVFTGYHMLGVMVLFFGTIITVNLVMARFAITTWTGLVVENSYVASQEFNARAAEMKAIDALGYKVDLDSSDKGFFLDLSDRTGAPVSSDVVEIEFHHPVGQVGDETLTLSPRGHGRFGTDQLIPEGEWIASVTVSDGGDVVYKRAHRIHIRADGTLRK
jgi:nitrogen fixation protein FixH